MARLDPLVGINEHQSSLGWYLIIWLRCTALNRMLPDRQ